VLNPAVVRWVTLAMLAHALLAVVRARDHPAPPDGLIALTCNEIQAASSPAWSLPCRPHGRRL
jgi:hypothetical protein